MKITSFQRQSALDTCVQAVKLAKISRRILRRSYFATVSVYENLMSKQMFVRQTFVDVLEQTPLFLCLLDEPQYLGVQFL